jgi:tetratricopeptide (TPR) repeat protein
MSQQIDFLLVQVHRYIQEGNFPSARLFINQILRVQPKHPEALRLNGVIQTLEGNHEEALGWIERAIQVDKKNGVAYSNKGSILLELDRPDDAINCYKKAIQLNPTYAEAYSNLGNAYQKIRQYDLAISAYHKALSIESSNPMFLCNLGNAQWKLGLIDDAIFSYKKVLHIDPNYVDARNNLAHLDLLRFNFEEGWKGYEYRWISNENRPSPLQTTRPVWQGASSKNRLLVWGEQGIGDQILYASMLGNLMSSSQPVTLATDKKLVNLFQRSFPSLKVVDKQIALDENLYNEHIPMGSLGQFFRSDIHSFKNGPEKYLILDDAIAKNIKLNIPSNDRPNCGLSWSSSSSKLSSDKSIALQEMSPIFQLHSKLNFVNLQYGETAAERNLIKESLGVSIHDIEAVDLYDDLDGLLAVIAACEIIVTCSNTTAHLAGALGKETLLLLPVGNAKFWYWHNIEGKSLWYPSVRVFPQKSPGDWSDPIMDIKNFLEKRFEF